MQLTSTSAIRSCERHANLLGIESEEAWSRELFEIGRELGFCHTLVALLPRPGAKLEQAFVRSNYPTAWRERYDNGQFAYVDPTVAHCAAHATSLTWSPEVFQSQEQRRLYEEACAYGLRSGVTLPIHGPKGESGMLCCVNDGRPGTAFRRELAQVLGQLSLLRDFVFESAIRFAAPSKDAAELPLLTPRELECLQWTAAGKSTWEISMILSCSESVVNFHIANVRQKFDVGTRREAVVKAIRLGLISVD